MLNNLFKAIYLGSNKTHFFPGHMILILKF